MKVCVATIPSHLSRAMHRISHALEDHAPADVRCVATWEEADFVLYHLIGIEDVRETIARVGKPHAIFQHCFLTSRASWADWLPIWAGARLVTSWMDLEWQAAVAKVDTRGIRFQRLPLGVDTDTFKPCGCSKQFTVGTSGYVADQECLNEWAQAIAEVNGRLFHLGPPTAFTDPVHAVPPYVVTQHGMNDTELAKRWSRCAYVSGLRRSEGFELPAYEGLACGARPIMFDRVDARSWLGEHAEYVREGSSEDVVTQLRAIVRGPYRPVTAAEREWVRATFSWEILAAKWWQAVLPR